MERLNSRIVLPVLVATICLSLIASWISIYSDQQNFEKANFEMVGLSSVSGNDPMATDPGLRELSIRNSRSLFMASLNQNNEPQTNEEQRPDRAESTVNRSPLLSDELATFELHGLNDDLFRPEVPDAFPREFTGDDDLGGDSEANTGRLPVSLRDDFTAPRIQPISKQLKRKIEEISSQENRPTVFHRPSMKEDATVPQKIADANRHAKRGKASVSELERWRALFTIAESLDRQAASTRHSNLLSNALTAIREAEDFTTSNDDISLIVADHETPILQSEGKASVSGVQAMFVYFQYAESLLGKAFNGNVSASETLLSLGRQFADSNQFGGNTDYQNAKATVMYRLAVLLNPTDARAMSELGLLYANLHQLAEAKELLKSSLRIAPDSSTWEILASVHATLGEQQLAQMAMQESRILARSVGQGE